MKNKQREGKLTAPIGYVRLSVVVTGPGAVTDDGDNLGDGSGDREDSNINLNGTTFVIIINDNDNINSVSLANPDKFLSFLRPNVSASALNDTSPSGSFVDEWSSANGDTAGDSNLIDQQA